MRSHCGEAESGRHGLRRVQSSRTPVSTSGTLTQGKLQDGGVPSTTTDSSSGRSLICFAATTSRVSTDGSSCRWSCCAASTTMEQFDTRFVVPVLRTFVDPADPDDIAAVNSLQDEVSVEASTSGSYEHPDYDEASRKETFDALVKLAEGLPDAERMFGKKGDVDPVRHLIGTAFGWGGLPTSEAYYLTRSEPRPVGRYALTLRDVPVDGFWSMTIYNGDGFLEANAHDAYSLNGVTAIADEDGSITLNLAPDRDGLSNYLYVMEGWNFVFRLYQPRPSVLDRTWSLPEISQLG